ncbi:MAG: carbon monoxide dehydrogenase [Lachnospiraceae bacterium]|nr:carbon monoxide dehydrogenase [Lachnospiraceae bacterium]
MKLYDAIIQETDKILMAGGAEVCPPDPRRIWKDTGRSELIMRKEAGVELGGNGQPSVNFTCVTTSGLIRTDEIWLCGPDLGELSGDAPFARIAILETEDLKETEDTEAAYQAVRNIEYVRYHVFPKGYMVRVSATTNEEQVRVSNDAMKRGIRFSYVGGTYIRKYKQVAGVKHVRVAFVTDPDTVRMLVPLAGKVDGITKTLTHILDGLPTDCGHCAMKPVCDEVEGLREMHLGGGRR